MMQIYFRPHINHQAETVFINEIVDHVLLQEPVCEIVYHNFPIPPEWLNSVVSRDDLIDALAADELLPANPRALCLEDLARCPDKIKVTPFPHRVSFDLVIVHGEEKYFFEFHEEPHRRLTVCRDSYVYAENGAEFVVQRRLQRLVRDVWRMQVAPNYTVVWFDWFAANGVREIPILKAGLREFYLPGNFSFSAFM